MIYTGLDNEVGYQVRVRSINAEKDCEWSPPLWGMPTDVLTPRYPTDRFGTQPVGPPDQNWRFLTQNRCTHTSNGVSLDAYCEYENIGPNTSRIFLDFDDPSRGSCAIRLVYSTLTAGSFYDGCFNVGAKSEVPFDIGFRLPTLSQLNGDDSAPTPTESIPQRAPRNSAESIGSVREKHGIAYLPDVKSYPASLKSVNRIRTGKGSIVLTPRGYTHEGIEHAGENPDFLLSGQVSPQLAPRNKDEFSRFVRGRYDFIPGLDFRKYPSSPGLANKIDYRSGRVVEIPGTYEYENISQFEGELVFKTEDGETYIFNLEFEPSSNVRVSVSGPDGQSIVWPGALYLDSELATPPMVLLVPPSWSAAIAIEVAYVPKTLDELFELIRMRGGDFAGLSEKHLVPALITQLSYGNFAADLFTSDKYDPIAEISYRETGHGSTQAVVKFTGIKELGTWDWLKRKLTWANISEAVTSWLSSRGPGKIAVDYFLEYQRKNDLNFSGLDLFERIWEFMNLIDNLKSGFDLFVADWLRYWIVSEYVGTEFVLDIDWSKALYRLTVKKEGEPHWYLEGFIDFAGDSINLNEFPKELLPPIAPPQASGEDYSGVEVAAAISAPEIGGADIQTFLVSNQGLQEASYSPGDWLEPKDGSNQRMMIVGATQLPAAWRQPIPSWTNVSYQPSWLRGQPSSGPLVLWSGSWSSSPRFLSLASRPAGNSDGSGADYALLGQTAITPLLVVCMQKDQNIPTRGARYFSSPKAAASPTQMCQRDCVLSGQQEIQECVWKCEDNQP